MLFRSVVWFDPRLEVEYHPRASWSKLARQFFDTGFWRGQLTRKDLRSANPRYFAPPALVKVAALGVIVALLGWPWGWLPLVGYLAAVALVAVTARGLSAAAKFALLLALPTMHFAWGLGFIPGFLKAPKR